MVTRRLAVLSIIGVLSCLGPGRVGIPDGMGTGILARTSTTVRVVSWNVSSDAFVRDPSTFRALLTKADADVVLLDEVAPTMTAGQVRAALADRSPARGGDWHISVGASGGRQRGVIATRLPLTGVSELSEAVPYPPDQRDRLHARMVAAGATHPGYAMDGGIPVNGAIVSTSGRRLLVVVLDLQCCGDEPASWEEDRRRVETREIRRRVTQVMARTRVDGLIVAGDFNLVSTPLPLNIAAGPYPRPIAGLLAAELRHLDGSETWTWDGRGTPFPSRPMDFVLYSPHALALTGGYVLDSADLSEAERNRLGLGADAATRLSAHLPLVTEFSWQ